MSVAFTGDGSTNIGAFHESLNMAAVWRLPVVVGHREQPLRRVQSPCRDDCHLASLRPGGLLWHPGCSSRRQRSAGGPKGRPADAFARARVGEGPTLIEADTYRHEGHSRSDPAKYRPEGELEEWLGRDPIPRFEGVLYGCGHDRASEELGARSAPRWRAEVKAALETGQELAGDRPRAALRGRFR